MSTKKEKGGKRTIKYKVDDTTILSECPNCENSFRQPLNDFVKGQFTAVCPDCFCDCDLLEVEVKL